MSIIIFLIILSALVIVHEIGHFSVAKTFGIRVDEFGLGFPPKIKKVFAWKGTDFTLNWFPFGGFVKIFGENPSEGSEDITNPDALPASGLRHDQNLQSSSLPINTSYSFQDKNRGVQALVLVAGVVGNLIFAWALFVVSFLIGLPASILGVLDTQEVVRLTLWDAIISALALTYNFTILISEALGTFILQAFTGTADLSQLTGPIGLVDIVGDISIMGFVYLLAFTAIISINLAIVNLLPIPALDGGRLLFVAIEAIARRSISARVFNALNTAGFALLAILMVLVTIQDFRNIF